jgi:hypothetical protein
MKRILKSLVLLLGMLMVSAAAIAQNIYGDVNGDLEVNIADVNAVIKVILGGPSIQSADVNNDDEINIADVNAIISVILGDQPKTLYSTILVTTRDGVTVEHLIDQNTRVSIEKPNLIIETDGEVLTYDLEHMARLRYGKRLVSAGQMLGSGSPLQEDGVVTDGDDHPQYALFTYRNDDDFNAFLNIDVDSITYSNTDLNGVTHGNAVVQQVWTPDSLYRIPLAAIDSVAFRAPDPVFKNDVFHITESHIPYVKEVTENSVVFSPSIPDSMLPSLGQVMISDVYDVPFDEGFAGRVLDIYRKSTYIRITCADVTLDDVYDQIIAVGKTLVYNDDDLPQGAPRKIHIYEDGTVSVSLGTVSLDLFTEKEIDQFTDQPTGNKDNYVKVSVSPELSMDYTICYHIKGVEDKFKVIFNTNLDCDFDFKWPQTSKPVTWEKYCPTFIPIPTSIPGLYSKICFGGYMDINGSVQLKADIPFTLHNRIGYDSDKEDYNGLVFDFKGTKFETPVVTMSLNAEASVGLALKYVTCIVAEKISSADIKLKAGPKASGSFEISSEGYSPDGWSWYDAMKDSKFSFQWVNASVSGGVKIFKWKKDLNFNLPIDELFPALGKRTYYLFPNFTEPTLRDRTDASGYSLTALTSDMTRDIIFSVTPGFGLYDQDNNPLYESFSTQKYRYEEDWDGTDLQMELKNYPPGTYTAVPIFKNSIFGTVKARPVAEVTIPEPVELEKTVVYLKKGETQILSMSGGWGIYYLENGDQGFACASFVTDGHDGDWGQSWPPKNSTDYPNVIPSIKITGLDYGEASITLRDVRSSQVITLTVNVTDEQGTSVISVTPTSIDFGDVMVGTLHTQILEIVNNSSLPQTVTVEVTPPFSIAHNESSMSSLTVEVPGNSCTPVTIMFKASQEDDYLGTATFTSNAISGGSCVVPLHGRGMTENPGNSVLSVIPDEIDFGIVPAGTTHVKTISLINNTTSAKKVTSTVLATFDSFAFYQGQSCASSLTIDVPAMGCSYVTMSFMESLPGDYSGTVKFQSDAFEDGECYVPLHGRAVIEGQGLPVISVSPSRMDFRVPVGQSMTKHLTVSNVGDGILRFLVSETQGPQLTIPESGQEFSLNAGESKVFDVICTPSGSGYSFGPIVRIYSNAENGTQGVAINATGVEPEQHEYVDLGLPSGTLWATCNVGANAPEDYGDYFAWGETEPKNVYSWETYKWSNGYWYTLTKYCTNSDYGYNGFTDDKTELDPEDDAAYVNWGSSWRMPSMGQILELDTSCTWQWTTHNGVNGYLGTGPNGNTIFLPAVGNRWDESLNGAGSYGDFWSRSLGNYSDYACGLAFSSFGVGWSYDSGRMIGQPVRAVRVP